MSDKQTKNRRSDGKFAKGNTLGNKFKKGQSGNPNGRRGALADIIKKVWDEQDESGLTQKEKMVRRVLSMAMNGSMTAVSYLSDRAEGKAKETREVSHKTEPIKILSID
jgi:hypothetical protein|tara:strand:- start:95 stop:421 length:327 start_codon:yes stop_codon:yes gene_type:complete